MAVFDSFYEKLRKIVSPGDEIVENTENKLTPKPNLSSEFKSGSESEIKVETKKISISESKSPAPQLIEGVDFYWEGPYMVLTAKYLFKRGYCCESGCRHCPYGFNKKSPKKA